MYYYGNTGYYGGAGYGAGCGCGSAAPYGYAGYTTGGGIGAAIWIVLFILLIIILGAGSFGNNCRKDCDC